MYKVNEIFETLQGEGYFTGTAVVFIRLQGCQVACSWCDTKQTWAINPKDETTFSAVLTKCTDSALWATASVNQIIDHIQAHYSAKHVVITGGEPCNYDLLPLTSALEAQGYFCQIETSGTAPIFATANTWVTLSAKINMKGQLPVLPSALVRANEIKHPVARQADIDALDSLLGDIDISNKVIALQPISQQARATTLCMQTCIKRNWRLSVQLHKYLNIA